MRLQCFSFVVRKTEHFQLGYIKTKDGYTSTTYSLEKCKTTLFAVLIRTRNHVKENIDWPKYPSVSY